MSTQRPTLAFAHSQTLPDGVTPAPFADWEPLFTPFGPGENECQKDCCKKCESCDPRHGHLNKVAFWAARFAASMFPPGSKEAEAAWHWGWLAGLWHDLGKFPPEWQAYLRKKVGVDIHGDEALSRVDHSTAGALLSLEMKPFGPLMSYMIAGHHAGLADATPLFKDRFKRPVHAWRAHAEAAGVPLNLPLPLPPLKRPDAGSDGLAFMLRYFFSCLVDADFLTTEAFMQPERFRLRPEWPEDIIDRMLEALEKYLAEKFGNTSPDGSALDDEVRQARETVRRACAQAAEKNPGFFALTVPTGGGKTLSSLLFALRHARKHGLRRVILVIPFTSIIKQNADVFREVFSDLSKELGREIVLEHHSKFDPKQDRENTLNRVASENWNAPLVVTTNVRFFESLFACRTTACRKLHRTARSVVIFDEVQALPASLLHPIIRGLRCLVHDLGSTAVLCTATQPALDRREDFPVGIPPEEVTEIIQDKAALFQSLERVTCENLGALDDDALISHVLENAPHGCLLILNTTKAARTIYEKLRPHTHALHLSARMCPRHVSLVLAKVKRLRRKGESVVLVSTQIVEAGVDISFPVVYRAECGLDSLAQSAGRCNRNGELRDSSGERIKGRVFLFQPLDHPIPKGLADIAANAGITRAHILPNLEDRDPLQPEFIRTYFEHAIVRAGEKNRWDQPGIVSGETCFPTQAPTVKNIQTYRFKTAAERFRLINSETHSVFIPWGPKGKKLEQEIRDLKKQNRVPNGGHFRRAQPFTVQVYDEEWKRLQPLLSFHCDDAFAILDHPENDYHPETGLKRPGDDPNPEAFCL